ncbi:hypothetical protein TFKS16_2028 [Tannerella forsythia KS16]|uniref:hypothetical protein n=1 Tax=Tannerella forsythia TaxID=28112 RepID=UPI000618B67D|nr:hypothetical protein [Tannerella forsythia]BAR52241.1 hypothetical protein TFKS16_2028 [Tannerella forsythia KS16]
MKIYDKNNALILDVAVDDSSYAETRIHEANTLTLYYSLPEYVEIPEGAYVDFQGERFTLESSQKFTCYGDRNFEYTVIFDGPQAKLRKYKVRDTTIQNLLKFAYTATPRQHLTLIVKALNRREAGWQIGECIDAPEKTLSYNHTYCIDALQMLADEFKTEWEITGKTVHLRRVEYNKSNPLRLRYGQDCGLKPGVSRENFGTKSPCEILLVQGGSKNIDASAYGSVELLLPKLQTIAFDGVKFSDEAGFDASSARSYTTDATGTEVTRTDRPLVTYAEDSVDLSSIYPKRVGTVSAVEELPGKDNTKVYDIIDASIPDALDYSKALIKGQSMKIIFQSGTLSGREFEVKYKHAERRFMLVNTTYDGIQMPGGAVYIPKPGDTYAVFGCALPDAYVCDNATKTGASWEMFREAVRVKFENETERYTFSGELDELFAERRWLEIGAKIVKGGYVLLESDKFADASGLLIRITGVRTPVNNPRRPQIELSNVASSGSIAGRLNKIEQNEAKTEDLFNQIRRETSRTYDHAKEAQEMLEKALDGFTAGVNPIWVRTMSVLLGNEYQQIIFVDGKTDSQREVIPAFEMNNETKVFTAPASILKHMTLGIDKTSSAHKASDFKYWDVAGYTSPFLGDDKAPYYLVAKCAKAGAAGSFLLQKEYKYDPGDGFYYFLVGLLSSETGGSRSFATAYGYTEILPGQMRIRMIISPDGRTYFNVAQGIIGGNIRIESGSTGYANLTDKPDLTVYKTKAEFNVFSNQISGQVSQINTRLGGTESGLSSLNTWTRQKVSQVESGLSGANDRIYALQTAGFITQAQGNTLYASAQDMNGNRLVSLITQTPTAINLLSRNINLSGNVTFTNFQSSVNNSLSQKQGKNDPFDMNNARINGQTVIEGGFIKTSLINTKNLVVSGGARIGAFRIQDGKLKTYYAPPSEGESWDWASGTDTELSHHLQISGILPNNTATVSKYGFELEHSAGGAKREFSITIQNTGDATWYKRVCIRATVLPHKNAVRQLSTIENAISNTQQFWEVLWDARSGCFCLGQQY